MTTINFGSCGDRKRIIDNSNLVDGEVRHTTLFFRGDLAWNCLCDNVLESPIKDIYVGACSDGSEAVSLKMLLEKKAPERKFNVSAFDIAKDHIAQAKCGIIKIWTGDDPTGRVGEDIKAKNLQKIPGSKCKETINDRVFTSSLFKMTDHLREDLKFMVADAVEVTKKKFQEPILFMFRNVWPYLNMPARVELAKNLAQNLPAKSIVAIGDYDDISHTSDFFHQEHFEAIFNVKDNLFRHI